MSVLTIIYPGKFSSKSNYGTYCLDSTLFNKIELSIKKKCKDKHKESYIVYVFDDMKLISSETNEKVVVERKTKCILEDNFITEYITLEELDRSDFPNLTAYHDIADIDSVNYIFEDGITVSFIDEKRDSGSIKYIKINCTNTSNIIQTIKDLILKEISS